MNYTACAAKSPVLGAEDIAQVDLVGRALKRALWAVELAALGLRVDDPNLYGANCQIRVPFFVQFFHGIRRRNHFDAYLGRPHQRRLNTMRADAGGAKPCKIGQKKTRRRHDRSLSDYLATEDTAQLVVETTLHETVV